jgi:hypothetical protein
MSGGAGHRTIAAGAAGGDAGRGPATALPGVCA